MNDPSQAPARRKLTKKAFREHLNERFPFEPDRTPRNRIGNGSRRYGPTARDYGDYLYAQDREKFDMEYREWLEAKRRSTP